MCCAILLYLYKKQKQQKKQKHRSTKTEVKQDQIQWVMHTLSYNTGVTRVTTLSIHVQKQLQYLVFCFYRTTPVHNLQVRIVDTCVFPADENSHLHTQTAVSPGVILRPTMCTCT